MKYNFYDKSGSLTDSYDLSEADAKNFANNFGYSFKSEKNIEDQANKKQEALDENEKANADIESGMTQQNANGGVFPYAQRLPLNAGIGQTVQAGMQDFFSLPGRGLSALVGGKGSTLGMTSDKGNGSFARDPVLGASLMLAPLVAPSAVASGMGAMGTAGGVLAGMGAEGLLGGVSQRALGDPDGPTPMQVGLSSALGGGIGAGASMARAERAISSLLPDAKKGVSTLMKKKLIQNEGIVPSRMDKGSLLMPKSISDIRPLAEKVKEGAGRYDKMISEESAKLKDMPLVSSDNSHALLSDESVLDRATDMAPSIKEKDAVVAAWKTAKAYLKTTSGHIYNLDDIMKSVSDAGSHLKAGTPEFRAYERVVNAIGKEVESSKKALMEEAKQELISKNEGTKDAMAKEIYGMIGDTPKHVAENKVNYLLGMGGTGVSNALGTSSIGSGRRVLQTFAPQILPNNGNRQ